MIGDEVSYREWIDATKADKAHWETRTATVVATFPASEFELGFVGRRFRSISYNSKNKTARARTAEVYEVTDVYAHRNGNIVVNNGHRYLKHDTEMELLE